MARMADEAMASRVIEFPPTGYVASGPPSMVTQMRGVGPRG